MKRNFTKEQFTEFFRLVNMAVSESQMDRISSRLEIPEFVREVGKNVCDEMYNLILNGVTPSTLEEV